MKDWDDYRFILALERSKTLRGAAEMLGVNHSTVSRKLAWLNERRGKAIFERSPKGYLITEFGSHFLSVAEEMEMIALSATRKQKALQNQSIVGEVVLSVSAPVAQFILADKLAEFAQQFPNIELCLDTTEENVDLDRSEADIVVRSTNNPPEHLVGRRLFPYAVCYYAYREYFKRTALENFNWVGSKTDSHAPEWLKQTPYPAASVTVRTTNYQTRYLALTSGLGLARGACFMADTNPELMRLPNTKPFDSLDFWILTHPDLRDAERIKIVMKFLYDTFMAKKDLIRGRAEQTN